MVVHTICGSQEIFLPRVDEESRFTKAVITVREWLPTVKPYLHDRYAFVRETPGVFWRLPEIRYPLILLGGLLVVSLARFAVGFLSPLPESELKPLATTGDFRVICTNHECSKEFVINRKFKFDDFPVQCPACEQQTGHRALRCHSKNCGGRVVPTDLVRGQYLCKQCNKVVKKE